MANNCTRTLRNNTTVLRGQRIKKESTNSASAMNSQHSRTKLFTSTFKSETKSPYLKAKATILLWHRYIEFTNCGVIGLLVILRALVNKHKFCKNGRLRFTSDIQKEWSIFSNRSLGCIYCFVIFRGPCLFSYCFWTRVIVGIWIISDGNLSSNNSRSFESDFRLSNAPQATRSSRTCLCRRTQRKSTILVYWGIPNNSLHWYRTSFSIA